MKSKAEIIRSTLKGKRVIDIGGSGYGESNPYEAELAESWKVVEQRLVVDSSVNADIRIDLNELPLPGIPSGNKFDVALVLDVLEHLEHPVEVLQWIPTRELILQIPNVLSPVTRWMERKFSRHLYNFTINTATNILETGGWKVNKYCYTFGKWSALARFINLIGSMCPAVVATGIMLHCTRISDEKMPWKMATQQESLVW